MLAESERVAVAIGKDTMGEGSEELGKILIKGFIYSLSELPVAPASIMFFNSGVFLAAEGANTVGDLRKLEARGAKILICGTCVDYYGLQGKLAVGTVTDMYGITEELVSAGKVINI